MKTCFSTEVVDLDRQAPNRNKRESKYYWDELYTFICGGGFDSIEIPYEPKWDFGGRSGIPRTLRSLRIKFGSVQNYMKALSAVGIHSIDCIHLDPTLFCAGPADMYFGAFTHFAMEAVEMAEACGCPAVTLSATPTCYAVNGLLSANPGMSEDDFVRRTAQVIDTVSQKARTSGITLCIKNEFWGLLRGKQVLSFLEMLDNGAMLDIDTAHLQIAGTDITDFIKANADKIGIVHFTDTAFIDQQEDYASPLPEFPALAATKVFRDIGDGSINFKTVMTALKDIGYDGTIVYNCRNSYDTCRSILRTRYYIDHVLGE